MGGMHTASEKLAPCIRRAIQHYWCGDDSPVQRWSPSGDSQALHPVCNVLDTLGDPISETVWKRPQLSSAERIMLVTGLSV